MYISHETYYIFLYFFLLKHKREQKTSGIFDPVFEKLMHQSSLMAVNAIVSKLSWCSSETLDEIILQS